MVHTSSYTVCNLFFDVVPLKSSKTERQNQRNNPSNAPAQASVHFGQDYESSCILHDITFNHIHESETHDLHTLKKEYFSTSQRVPTYKDILQAFKLKPSICLKPKISKFAFYNAISKAIKKKYKKYIQYGEVRALFPKILEICVRYMENIDQMKCSQCGRFARIVKREGAAGRKMEVDYCVLNHGNDFYHETCIPESIKHKII